MRRSLTGILMISGLLLSFSGNVFSETGDLQTKRTDKSGIGDSLVNDRQKKPVRTADKKVVIAAQESGLRDVAMRFAENSVPSVNPGRERPVEESAGSSSWLAMFLAGLGVALISIIRRLRSIR